MSAKTKRLDPPDPGKEMLKHSPNIRTAIERTKRRWLSEIIGDEEIAKDVIEIRYCIEGRFIYLDIHMHHGSYAAKFKGPDVFFRDNWLGNAIRTVITGGSDPALCWGVLAYGEEEMWPQS